MILSSQFLRHRHFSRKLIATISTKLKREHLVDPDIVTTALSKETMFDFKEGKIAEVPIPPSVKKAGTIPDGFTIDYHLDPNFAISTLAINGITTIEELPKGLFENMKRIINGHENVTLAPISVVESKRELLENSLKKVVAEEQSKKTS